MFLVHQRRKRMRSWTMTTTDGGEEEEGNHRKREKPLSWTDVIRQFHSDDILLRSPEDELHFRPLTSFSREQVVCWIQHPEFLSKIQDFLLTLSASDEVYVLKAIGCSERRVMDSKALKQSQADPPPDWKLKNLDQKNNTQLAKLFTDVFSTFVYVNVPPTVKHEGMSLECVFQMSSILVSEIRAFSKRCSHSFDISVDPTVSSVYFVLRVTISLAS
jgi:hypothetical protein